MSRQGFVLVAGGPRRKKTKSFFCLLSLLAFSACVTTSPVISNKEDSVFSNLESVKPMWQAFGDGIDYLQGKVSEPRLEFWALKIDLASPNIRVVVKGGAESENGTLSAKVSSFVRDNNLLAGINAVPFDISSSKEGQPIKNAGLVISEGKLVSPPNPAYDALVFNKNGKAEIVSQAEILSIENIDNAAGGFHRILSGGEPAERTENREDRHPRSAAGISRDGEILYLLVIDGRRAGSLGGTERETALLLRSLGGYDGINLDGGGSSALALRFEDGGVRTVNPPVHNGIPGVERAVAGCVGVTR